VTIPAFTNFYTIQFFHGYATITIDIDGGGSGSGYANNKLIPSYSRPMGYYGVQMRKLSHRVGSFLLKVTQLENGRNGTSDPCPSPLCYCPLPYVHSHD
jgi:hypothetical protein